MDQAKLNEIVAEVLRDLAASAAARSAAVTT